MKKNSMDNIFEELLKEGASLAADELGEEISKQTTDDFSEEHTAKMNKLFARERRKQRMKKFGVYATRIAAVLIVAATVSGVAIFNVDALKVRFLNMFTVTQPTNTEISYKDGTSYSNDVITIGYVPEGFVVENERNSNDIIHIKFKNDDKYFIVDVRDSYGDGSIDTEDAAAEKIEVDGYEVLYSYEENTNIFSYYIDGYAIEVIGDVEKSILMQIIRNVKLN